MFAVLCTQHRCCFVEGYTSSRAAQNPRDPSPMASNGAMLSPRAFTSSMTSFHDSLLSRMPSRSATSSFTPSSVTPMMTNMQARSVSSRTLKYIPSTQTYTYRLPLKSCFDHCAYSCSQTLFNRVTVLADRLLTFSPNIPASAAGKSLVEIPFRYSTGTTVSILGARRAYAGSNALVNTFVESSSRIARSSTRGCRTGMGPIPVKSVLSLWYPLRTTSRRPCSSRTSRCCSRNSATSDSTAAANICRAPVRSNSSNIPRHTAFASVASTGRLSPLLILCFTSVSSFDCYTLTSRGYAFYLPMSLSQSTTFDYISSLTGTGQLHLRQIS